MLGLSPMPLLSFGSGNPSVAPVLVSVTDNGDQDAATATVTGTGTIQLYYRIRGVTAWTTGNTRSGDGTIVQTGLTAAKWYEFYCTADANGIESAPSAIVTLYLDDAAVMAVERAIFTIMSGDATVGGLAGDRIYPNYVPQDTAMPAVTYQQISGPRDNTLDGPSGLVNSRFQLNSWAATYAECDELTEAVRKAMSGFSGTVGSLIIQVIQVEDEGDIPAVKPGNDQLRRLGKRMDYRIWYCETP